MAQQFDKAFKLLAGDDPRGLLALFTNLPLDPEIEVRRLDREVIPPNKLVDQAFEVTSPTSGTYLLHIEVTTRFRSEVYERAAWQVSALVSAYRLPVHSYFVVLTDEWFPEGGIEPYEADFGSIRLQVRPEVVRVWEIPGTPVLEMNRPSLYPWVTLLRATEEQQLEATRRVVESGDREAVLLVAVLSGLRYRDKGRFLRRYIDVTVHELFQESDWYQEALAKGRASGIAEGRASGIAEGEQSLLLRQLRARFGTVPQHVERKVLGASKDALERWGVQLLTARSIDEALS